MAYNEDDTRNLALANAEMADMSPLPDQVPEEEAQPKSGPEIVDDEIMSMINTRKGISQTWKDAKQAKWDKCWDHYNQIYDETNKESWQSTTFIPASSKVAEVICSNMHAATLGPELPAEYQARLTEHSDMVENINKILKVDLDQSMFKVHWTDIERTLCILGTGIGKIDYKKEKAVVKVKKRVRQIPGMDRIREMLGFPIQNEIMEEQEVIVKDHASIKNVDPYDFFPQPGLTELSKDTWVIERGKITNARLLELQNDPDNPVINITEEVLMSTPRAVGTDDGRKQEKEMANDEPIKPQHYLDPDQEHELLEYWGPAPLWMIQPELYGVEEAKYEVAHAWFWLIDGKYVVRRQRTPFMDAEPPYIAGQYIRVPGQFWGIGPLELILGLQVELNELRNTRQDNVNLILNKVIAVMKDSVAQNEWGRLISEPGALWLFSNIDDVKKAIMTVDFPDITADSWRSSQEIYNEIQEVTAAVKATIGTGGGDDQAGADTFRGQLLNKQMAGERFIMYARTFEKTGLAKAIHKFYQRIYQYKDFETIDQILGEDAMNFELIQPDILLNIAKIVPMGVTTMENKGVKLAQKRDEFQTFRGSPWFKEVEAARRMVEIGGDDPDQTIMTDDELEEYNQAKRSMMAQLPGMEGVQGGGPTLNGVPPQIGPIAGGSAPPSEGMPQPPQPSRGPGASNIDVAGRPV